VAGTFAGRKLAALIPVPSTHIQLSTAPPTSVNGHSAIKSLVKFSH
jgi:hypothetical protein